MICSRELSKKSWCTCIGKPDGAISRSPAMLALAIILQTYTGASDDAHHPSTTHGSAVAARVRLFGHGASSIEPRTLVAFRQRHIEAQMDRRLIERANEIADQSRAFGLRALRAPLDSSLL